MDPEVVMIPPTTSHSSQSKQKQAVIHEVIDVDKDEDSADILVLDVRDKGKVVKSSFGHNSIIKAEDIGAKSEPSKHADAAAAAPAPGSHNMANFGYDLSDDDEPYDYYDGDFDDYAMLQSHFDSVDIPAGVEASVPWFPDTSETKKEAFNGNSSLTDWSYQSQQEWITEPASINKKEASLYPKGASLSSPPLYPQASQSTNSSVNQSDAMMLQHPVTPAIWDHFASTPKHLGSGSSYPSNLSLPVEPSTSGWLPSMNPKSNFIKSTYSSFADSVDGENITRQEVGNIKNQRTVNEEDIFSKILHFKRFDTVEDFSDHHYASKGASANQPPQNWAKKIQEEWRMLEKDLPDTIFVRVYESRMDLLRAVIIGAEGTPYHDGLFFFDVLFPASYPSVPPHVYYHSGGLRLNPNLYGCGKVCLSLLHTWMGDKNEMWIPGTSTMLQVLVSIQALILNQKPYFNEPGFASLRGTKQGEQRSRKYNEDTLILSLKTMVYSMRKPPKHFEDFVVVHFYMRAHDILEACKAYKNGAQVGCLVKGGVQGVDEGDKSCSKKFKDSLAECVNILAKEFTVIGPKYCEKFLASLYRVDDVPKAAT